MAVHKCEYMIISNDFRKIQDLDISMYGKAIARKNEVTLLGFKMDYRLNFRSHVELCKENGIDRLNIIRTVSHASWALKKSTLLTLYSSLVRSISEYSAIILPCISSNELEKLEVIQRAAMRAIFNKNYHPVKNPNFSNADLETLHKLLTMKKRLELANRYIKSNLENNALIQICTSEFLDHLTKEKQSIRVIKTIKSSSPSKAASRSRLRETPAPCTN